MVIKSIIFNTDMVRAILDGRKTVTRRVVKLPRCGYFEHEPPRVVPPYQSGDILYVRETWSPVFVHPKRYLYKADVDAGQGEGVGLPIKWHPSIHMPKEAARIFLRVTDVRVEQLEEIFEDPPGPNNQIVREGCRYGCDFIATWQNCLKPADREFFGVDANPWVWVIEFERCKKPLQFADMVAAPSADQPVLMPATREDAMNHANRTD